MIGVFLWLGWRVFKMVSQKTAHLYRNPSNSNETGSDDKTDSDTPEPMQACALCGVHSRESRCLKQDDRFYCSQAHLEQHLEE